MATQLFVNTQILAGFHYVCYPVISSALYVPLFGSGGDPHPHPLPAREGHQGPTLPANQSSLP